MLYKAYRISSGILVPPMIYGNAFKNIAIENLPTQNIEVHTRSFIMKCVEMSMMLKQEKNILKQEWVNTTLRIGLSVSYL